MLTVTRRAPTEELITVEAVRDQLLGGDTSEDASLARIIRGASSAMANHVFGDGAALAYQEYSALVPGTGRLRLLLPRYPVDPDSVTVTIDGTALAATAFSVESPGAGILYRSTGWPIRSEGSYITVAFRAGWALPGMVSAWAADEAVAAYHFVAPTSAPLSPLLYEVTTAGDLGTTEPTWPTTPGETVASGTAVLTGRRVGQLPAWVEELAYVEVVARREGKSGGLLTASFEAEGVKETWFRSEVWNSDLFPAVAHGLDRLAELRVG